MADGIGKTNIVDKAAADVLLDSVSMIGESAQVIVVIKNKDEVFSVTANCNMDEIQRMMHQTAFILMAEKFGLIPSERHADEDESGEEEEDA